MIQFNLLPDVKVQFIKTRRLKRIMMLVALAATALSVLLLFLTFSYTTVQKRHLTNLDRDIDALVSEFEGNNELTRILSVQNQLNALPALYNGRPAVNRLPSYLDQTTPVGILINHMSIDFSTSAIEITGTARDESGQAQALELVNSYVDTLKYTAFQTDEEGVEPQTAFSAIVLTQFSRDNIEASFTVSFTFNASIFDGTKQVELTVPDLVTTRVQTTSPAELFTDEQGEDVQESGGE